MYPCLINRQGDILVHRNMQNREDLFLAAVAAYRENLVVVAESTSNWYWLADLCAREMIEFVLGHALYMKAIHGSKTKNDRIDSEKIARLTAAGVLPQAYVYPRHHRSLRDLMRRRLKLVRQQAELQAHIRGMEAQQNFTDLGLNPKSARDRKNYGKAFEDPSVRCSIEADLQLIEHYQSLIRGLERHIDSTANEIYRKERIILESIPGVGRIISLTLLLEIDQIQRFPRRQQFCSYARLVYPRGESAGKQYGTQGRKHGNPYLKWAFSEAAVHASRNCEYIGRYKQKLERKYGAGKGKSILAHKLGRAVYYMLLRRRLFDLNTFLRSS
jgi:transposase